MNRIILFLVSVLSVLSMQAQIVASKEGDNGKSGFIDSKGKLDSLSCLLLGSGIRMANMVRSMKSLLNQKGGINKWG